MRAFQRNLSRFFSQTEPDLRNKVILASLLYVNTAGFSELALVKACNDLDLSPASSRLVEMGPIEIVYHLLEDWDKETQLKMDKYRELHDTPTNTLKKGVKKRLNLIGPYIDHWDQALALLCHPANIKDSYTRMFRFSNDLLYFSEDRSIDVNFFCN